ncbi:hypothetical protein DMB65_17890 [Flavobacterium cheongpyeongense]|jgi:hypothetical protein|uniref:PASTA domain-containing protein n=2 Tax=Flavobacterium cheongpyeongense TaxID=2212651 RepID=A0A2V4BK39_9FLAO|nr:hypothetical protein DMB65_17890 [Flavobacterium cheongpyeongense]
MSNNSLDFMKEIMAAPLGELISSIGKGVGEAQAALDAGSLAQTLEIYNSENKDEVLNMLKSIGYQPTFYVLPETEVEAQVSFAISSTSTSTPSLSNDISRSKIYATPINAGNSNRFNLDINAMAKLKFKIVPVPPPDGVSGLRIIPSLIDKTIAQAVLVLNTIGLSYQLPDGVSETSTNIIKTQTPDSGTYTQIGTTIQLTVV